MDLVGVVSTARVCLHARRQDLFSVESHVERFNLAAFLLEVRSSLVRYESLVYVLVSCCCFLFLSVFFFSFGLLYSVLAVLQYSYILVISCEYCHSFFACCPAVGVFGLPLVFTF